MTLGKTEYGFSFDEQFDVFSNYNNTLGNKTEFVMSWRNGSLIYKKIIIELIIFYVQYLTNTQVKIEL